MLMSERNTRHRVHPSVPTKLLEPLWGKQTNIWTSADAPKSHLEDKKLNFQWTLWYHEVDDHRWTKESYQKIYTFTNWAEFWAFYDQMPTWLNGMFFLMRDGIFPQWEDEQNIRGGYWSYKIPKVIGDEAWVQLSSHVIGECATKKLTDMYYVNGIAISPKINNCIIKILNRDAKHADNDRLTSEIPYLPTETVAFKAHLENREEFVYD